MLDVLQRQTDSSSLSLSSSKHSTIHNSSSATGLKTTITRGQHSRHLRHTKSTIIHNTCQAHSRLQVNSNSQTRRMMFSSNPRLYQAKKEKAGACNTQHPNTLLRDSKSLFSSSRPNSLWTSILSRLRINLAVTKIKTSNKWWTSLKWCKKNIRHRYSSNKCKCNSNKLFKDTWPRCSSSNTSTCRILKTSSTRSHKWWYLHSHWTISVFSQINSSHNLRGLLVHDNSTIVDSKHW